MILHMRQKGAAENVLTGIFSKQIFTEQGEMNRFTWIHLQTVKITLQ